MTTFLSLISCLFVFKNFSKICTNLLDQMIQATHNKTKLLVLTDGAVFLTTQQKNQLNFKKYVMVQFTHLIPAFQIFCQHPRGNFMNQI